MGMLGRGLASLVLLLAAAGPARAGQRLVLLGGGTRAPEALARFVAWAGNGHSRLLVITWASPDPKAAFESVQRELSLYRPDEVRSAPPAPLEVADKGRFLRQLERATGVFFTGGDQGRIIDVLRDLDVLDALRGRYEQGATFAGTSAGTAIMSSLTITGEGDPTVINADRVPVRSGLGLLPGVILDQHFIKRQRANRLFGLVLEHPRLLGVGVDEGTALAVEDNQHAEVLGSSEVITVDARGGPGELVLNVLRPGDTFDLKTRRRGAAARRTSSGG